MSPEIGYPFSMTTDVKDTLLSAIREGYGVFRLPNPKAEKAMKQSLQRYGQISPVVCLETTGGLEVIDGFKRVRVSRGLKWSTLKTTILDTTARAGKAGIIQLNRISRSISDLEEAMVLESLYREDGMTQVEIGTLVGRDKSWVSRRISLIKNLADEVRQHIALGLITSSVGRELARLPRGNQVETLEIVLKHRLGKREVEVLVRHLLLKPQGQHLAKLDPVWDELPHQASRPETNRAGLSWKLSALRSLQDAVIRCASTPCADAERPRHSVLVATLVSTRKVETILEHLLGGRPLEDNQCR